MRFFHSFIFASLSLTHVCYENNQNVTKIYVNIRRDNAPVIVQNILQIIVNLQNSRSEVETKLFKMKTNLTQHGILYI